MRLLKKQRWNVNFSNNEMAKIWTNDCCWENFFLLEKIKTNAKTVCIVSKSIFHSSTICIHRIKCLTHSPTAHANNSPHHRCQCCVSFMIIIYWKSVPGKWTCSLISCHYINMHTHFLFIGGSTTATGAVTYFKCFGLKMIWFLCVDRFVYRVFVWCISIVPVFCVCRLFIHLFALYRNVFHSMLSWWIETAWGSGAW